MTAILEIPEVRQRVSPLSVAEYHGLAEFNENGRRTELIRGIVIEKMSKSPLHRSICSRLYRIFLAGLTPGFSAWKEEPLTFEDSEPEPDLSVTLGSEESYKGAHPRTAELVVEVAISSAALDRANAPLYADAGVKEYWIVLAASRQAEVYRRPEGGAYREMKLVEADGILSCHSFPQIEIKLADLFA